MDATLERRRRQRKIQLHPKQAKFRNSTALYRGFVAGRGAGKSWVGAYDLCRRAKRGRTYLVGSPTGVMMGDTTYPTFLNIARELGILGKIRLAPYPNVELTTGATIRFRTAEDPEKMRGPNLSGVWLDEASLMHEDAFTISIASLREAEEQGWLSATFTPKGLTHWTYKRFGELSPAGGPVYPNTELIQATTGENPWLPAEFEAGLREQYTGLRAAQELGGQYVNVEGAEWPGEYFGESLWFERWPPELKLKVLALDPSKGSGAEFTKRRVNQGKPRLPDYSAYVLLGLPGDGTMYVEGNLDRMRDTDRIVTDGLDLYDTWQPAAWAIEVNQFQAMFAPAFARAWRDRCRQRYPLGDAAPGLPLYGVTNVEPKIVRIRTIGPYLARREIRFRNTPGTKLLVNQLRDFPVAENDDGPDALALAIVMAWYMLGRRPERGSPQLLRV